MRNDQERIADIGESVTDPKREEALALAMECGFAPGRGPILDQFVRLVALSRQTGQSKDGERWRELVEQAEAIFRNCSVSDGTCCCGSSMSNHESPMHCGHSPYDAGEYAVSRWIERARAAIAAEQPAAQQGGSNG